MLYNRTAADVSDDLGPDQYGGHERSDMTVHDGKNAVPIKQLNTGNKNHPFQDGQLIIESRKITSSTVGFAWRCGRVHRAKPHVQNSKVAKNQTNLSRGETSNTDIADLP